MQGLKRALAAFLAAWLAGVPAASAAGFERASPVSGVSLPSAPLAPIAALPSVPSAAAAVGLPGIAPIPAMPSAASGGDLRSGAEIPDSAPAPLSRTTGDSGYVTEKSARAARALPQLQAAADPRLTPQSVGARFDGSRLNAAAPGEVPGSASGSSAPLSRPARASADGPGAPQPPSPSPKRPSWLARLNASTKSSRAEKWLERGVLLGAALTLAAPVAWHARPIHTLIMDAPAALVPVVAAFGALTLYRIGRFLLGRQPSAPRAPPKRSSLWRAAALGLALGAALGAAPVAVHPHLVQAVHHVVAPKAHAVVIPGDAVGRQVLADFAGNAQGRRILDDLRDRRGVVRLPTFMVGNVDFAVASYMDIYDAVFIGEDQIKGMGWTVADFLKDPAKQAQYVDQNQALFAHELTHTIQARRSPFEPGQYSETMEYEYEAYVAEHFYVHEQLKADPTRKDLGSELGGYEVQLDDINGFLKSLDSDDSYKHNVHLDSPRYRAWYAQLHAEWPAHRVEGYRLLAKRYARVPVLRRRYEAQAAAAAAQVK